MAPAYVLLIVFSYREWWAPSQNGGFLVILHPHRWTVSVFSAVNGNTGTPIICFAFFYIYRIRKFLCNHWFTHCNYLLIFSASSVHLLIKKINYFPFSFFSQEKADNKYDKYGCSNCGIHIILFFYKCYNRYSYP